MQSSPPTVCCETGRRCGRGRHIRPGTCSKRLESRIDLTIATCGPGAALSTDNALDMAICSARPTWELIGELCPCWLAVRRDTPLVTSVRFSVQYFLIVTLTTVTARTCVTMPAPRDRAALI